MAPVQIFPPVLPLHETQEGLDTYVAEIHDLLKYRNVHMADTISERDFVAQLSEMVQCYPALQNLVLAFRSSPRATPENAKNAMEHYKRAMRHLECYNIQVLLGSHLFLSTFAVVPIRLRY